MDGTLCSISPRHDKVSLLCCVVRTPGSLRAVEVDATANFETKIGIVDGVMCARKPEIMCPDPGPFP